MALTGLCASPTPSQDEVAALQGANRQLASRLEAAQQRVELLSQQAAQLGLAAPAAQQMTAPAAAVANGRPPAGPARAGKGGWGGKPPPAARRPALAYLS